MNDWTQCRICRQSNSFGGGHWAWHRFCRAELNPIALVQFIERNSHADAADKILRYVVAVTGMDLKAVRQAEDEAGTSDARLTDSEQGKAVGSADRYSSASSLAGDATGDERRLQTEQNDTR